MDAPAPINSASLHPDKDFFVAGGEDFKLYKFDYSTKEELGEEPKEQHTYQTFSLKVFQGFIEAIRLVSD